LAQRFLNSRLLSDSLEPLIGFLTHLEPKLWLKNSFLQKLKSLTKGKISISGQTLASHNSAADYARDLFKLCKG